MTRSILLTLHFRGDHYIDRKDVQGVWVRMVEYWLLDVRPTGTNRWQRVHIVYAISDGPIWISLRKDSCYSVSRFSNHHESPVEWMGVNWPGTCSTLSILPFKFVTNSCMRYNSLSLEHSRTRIRVDRSSVWCFYDATNDIHKHSALQVWSNDVVRYPQSPLSRSSWTDFQARKETLVCNDRYSTSKYKR